MSHGLQCGVQRPKLYREISGAHDDMPSPITGAYMHSLMGSCTSWSRGDNLYNGTMQTIGGLQANSYTGCRLRKQHGWNLALPEQSGSFKLPLSNLLQTFIVHTQHSSKLQVPLLTSNSVVTFFIPQNPWPTLHTTDALPTHWQHHFKQPTHKDTSSYATAEVVLQQTKQDTLHKPHTDGHTPGEVPTRLLPETQSKRSLAQHARTPRPVTCAVASIICHGLHKAL